MVETNLMKFINSRKYYLINFLNTIKRFLIIEIMIKVFFIKYKLKSKFKKKNKKYTKHLIEEFQIFDNSKNIGLFPYNAWDCL